MNSTGKEKREALLGELESIRTLLQEEAQSINDRDWLSQHGNIPVLVAEDQIPTLGPADHHNEKPASRIPEAPKPEPNPLQAIREAAAKVAANHARHRASMENRSTHLPVNTLTTTPAVIPSHRDREKLVDDIVRSALPRLESLLRELVQEALLQEKLRSTRR